MRRKLKEGQYSYNRPGFERPGVVNVIKINNELYAQSRLGYKAKLVDIPDDAIQPPVSETPLQSLRIGKAED